MSIIRLCLSSKAGAKVDNLSITSKYIGLFFYSFLKLFCNSLIDNDVIEYIFSDRHILIWNTYTLLYSALKCKFYFPIPNRNSIYIQDSANSCSSASRFSWISRSLTPQISTYSFHIEISSKLFKSLNTLTLPNFVTPVSRANFIYPSFVFKAP